MAVPNMLDWIVALLVCWASLTAIVQTPHEAAQCDVPYVTNSAPPIPTPTQAEIEEMIRDMKLHD
ncbi:hypothetical protein UP10_23790 [Bradyrhizobium sp. LTSPM299]|jgi:hypothetical protein|uniref:hypothetical protein n=1 Tax=Bradyrhizobium sp. LTSPM299 TaxID=1619233 RepID=UPI0005C96559|nr:hypothetical protein [Bradyrhizobium sp. LTSPM299]KJC58028.1 hypothetical protein UP10_23790 [Bradyrhizobium sp. LTSPM299]